MKKKLILFFFVLLSYNANSQVLISLLFGDKLNSPGVEFGLEGGLNLSTINGMETHSSLTNFNLGFYFDIRLKDPWYLYTGVLVKSRLGANKLSEGDLASLQTDIENYTGVYPEGGEYSQVLNYFIVPVLARYKLKNHIYFEAGPQFGLMHKAWIEYDYDEGGIDARIRDNNKDMINKIDVGVTGGLGYQLGQGKGITLGLKYYNGFVNVYKGKSGTTNNSLYVTACIPIGAGKKKQEENK